jgi:hypothetical protein
MMTSPTAWPEGKQFAFTIFDDTDNATLENVALVYGFLEKCGLRTTKSVWVLEGDPQRGKHPGQTCADPKYLQWILDLQAKGFEIGFHNCTWHGVPREAIRAALDKFAELFGHNPTTAANHSGVEEGIYWGDARLTGWVKFAYNLLTRFHNHLNYRGHIEDDDYYWGDLCVERVKYYRNFVFKEINTLGACPWMPYHDPLRPFVNFWYASSDGHDIHAMNHCISENAQDLLEEEGGACIMYTHFASGFQQHGVLDSTFQRLMQRLAKKNGWFVPVATLLDHLGNRNGQHVLTASERRSLEWKWLREKILTGTT